MSEEMVVLEALERPGRIPFTDACIRGAKGKPTTNYGFGSTPRTAKLREVMFSKAAVVKDFTGDLSGLGLTTFRGGQNIKIDLDRALIVTKAFKETEGQPWTLRKARAIEKLCDELPIFIKPGELIVSDPNSAPNELRLYPEDDVSFLPESLETGFKKMATEDEKRILMEEVYEYWKDRSLRALVFKDLPDDVKDYVDTGPYNMAGYASHALVSERAYCLPRYEDLYREGIRGRIARVEANLAKHKAHKPEGMNPAEYLKKKHNWEAMIIAGKAFIRFAERFAALAEEQAKAEKDPESKKELEEIAEICRWVPANPPRTFHEAIQFFWFVEVVPHYLEAGGVGCGIRCDQIWWPYYVKDLKEGRITRKKALELIECLFLKVQEIGMPIIGSNFFTMTAGSMIHYALNLGGTVNGKDASNDLTCLMLEAMANLRIEQPAVIFRYHPNVSPDVVERVIDLLRAGMGHPALFNEPLAEKYILMRGHPPEAAKDISFPACTGLGLIGGRLNSGSVNNGGAALGLKFLELAMYQGVDKFSGLQIGARTPDPTTFKSAEDLLNATLDQLEFYFRKWMVALDAAWQGLIDYNQRPLVNLLMDEPPETGEDQNVIAQKYDGWRNVVGEVTSIGDSLAAAQKLVWEDKVCTLQELIEACRSNWEGKEDLRQRCLRAPKWGNDDDAADYWKVKTQVESLKRAATIKSSWGHPMFYDGGTLFSYVAWGRGIGATPNGRKDGEPTADGTVSPQAGMDTKGPLAVLRSIAKIPKMPIMTTDLLNQRFEAKFLEGDNRKIFADYLRAWYEANTWHIQFNVVDTETLKKAQRNPDEYGNLMVRVAAYVGYFVDLSKEAQDTIIARTLQRF
jgi:pyruvate formate-lyase/glycerol dehydratase family glycyl radical enzyme